MKKYNLINSELQRDEYSSTIFVNVTYRLKWYQSKKKALEHFYALEGKEIEINNLRITCLYACWLDHKCKEICLRIVILPLSNGKPIMKFIVKRCDSQ